MVINHDLSEREASSGMRSSSALPLGNDPCLKCQYLQNKVAEKMGQISRKRATIFDQITDKFWNISIGMKLKSCKMQRLG